MQHYLPARDALLGRICNAVPRLFLSRVERARARGIHNARAGSSVAAAKRGS